MTLKKFLEGLVNKGHLAEYIKGVEKQKAKTVAADDDSDDEPAKRPANTLVTCVISVINASTSRDEITKNAIRVNIKRAQYLEIYGRSNVCHSL